MSHKDWISEDCEKVLVSDEMTISAVEENPQYVRRGPVEALRKECLVQNSLTSTFQCTDVCIPPSLLQPNRTLHNQHPDKDQFVLEEDGYGRIIGRLKEMINRGGENIFPKEIEDFLQTHPDILEAQVFGVDDVRLGEVVACSLRLKEGSALTQEDIRAYCKGMIAHFKIPKYFKFVTEFSKTSSGKIQKFKLKEEITKELESQKSFGENNSLLSPTTGAGENRK
uniref:AMP-binding enzyme C-terminal domain-containing protein n=1 Tax=Timema cristinae TaxID=61476 RepID=A0A7R9CIF7_TIMCR|nr:unnamed protein product [Timema cristinae]